MDCDRCGNEIEDYADVVCDQCILDLQVQARRTPVELTAEDLLKACIDAQKTLQSVKKNILELDKITCLVEPQIFSFTQIINRANPSNQSIQKH